MKKSFLGILTLIITMLTVIVYIGDNIKATEVNYNLPKTSFYSDKFGKVVGIFTAPFNSTENIIVLALDKENGTSNIHILNTVDGTSNIIMSFFTHDYIKDKVSFDGYGEDMAVPTKDGIYVTNINWFLNGKESNIINRNYPGFEYANSFQATPSEVVYTTNNTNFIYDAKIFEYDSNGNNNLNQYYKSPEKILFKNISSNEIYYTKIDKGHRGLYVFDPSNFRGNILEKKIIENFVHGDIGHSYSGMYGFMECKDGLTAFVEEMSNTRNIIEFDTIPFNHDSLGQIPDILVKEEGGVYKGIYTSFDENGLGSILLKSSIRDNPEVIVKDEFIVGKLCHINYIKNSEYSGLQVKMGKILYTALEDGKLKIKLVDLNDKSVEDITEFFGEVSI